MPVIERGVVRTCAALFAGCTSPTSSPREVPFGLRHDAGSNFVAARVHHGVPILQRSFFWDGNGEVEDSGVGVHVGHHLADRVALGVGTNLSTWWTSGRDVHSAELEALLRVHPFTGWPVFVDGTAGYQLADEQIPPGGTVWNFTFSFGGGLELPVAPATSLLLGTCYHHISNALGRDNDRNPSQNEARLWLGVEWSF